MNMRRVRDNGIAAVTLCALTAGSFAALGSSQALAVAPLAVSCSVGDCQKVTGALGVNPVSVALDGNGSAYVTVMSGELRKVDLATGSTTTVAVGLGNLRGLGLDGAGKAYVGSFDGRLQKVDLSSGTREMVASGLGPAHGVSFSNGVIYVSSGDGSLYAVKQGQAPKRVTAGFGLPLDVVTDGRGSAYVTDVMKGSVNQVNLATGATKVLDSGSYEPQSLSLGRDGAVYFLAGSAIHRVDPVTGTKTEVGDVSRLSTYDFTLADNGDAYVTVTGGELWRVSGLAR